MSSSRKDYYTRNEEMSRHKDDKYHNRFNDSRHRSNDAERKIRENSSRGYRQRDRSRSRSRQTSERRFSRHRNGSDRDVRRRERSRSHRKRYRSYSESSSSNSSSNQESHRNRNLVDRDNANHRKSGFVSNPFRVERPTMSMESMSIDNGARNPQGIETYYRRYRADTYKKSDCNYLKERREKREIIGEKGIADVWGQSPQQPEVYSDDEMHNRNDDAVLVEGSYRKLKLKKSKKTKKHSKKELKAKEKKGKLKKNKKCKRKASGSDSSTDSSENSSTSSNSASSSDSSDSEDDISESNSKDNNEIWVEKDVSKHSKGKIKKSSKKHERKEKKKKDKKKKKKHEKSLSKSDVKKEYASRGDSIKRSFNENNTVNDEDEFGPVLRQTSALNQKDFGRALLPGEGAAMAAYIAEGKRIPRRGEIGLTSEEIANFESVGYVMSGSR